MREAASGMSALPTPFETSRDALPDFELSPRSLYVRHRVEEMSGTILIDKGYALAANAIADLRFQVAAGRRTRKIRRPVDAHSDWLAVRSPKFRESSTVAMAAGISASRRLQTHVTVVP